MHIKLLIAWCLLTFAASAQTGKQLYQLKVTAKDSITGTPLEDAIVTLTKHAHAHITNSNGWTVFDTLRAGQYHIECSFIGYQTNTLTIELPAQQSIVVLMCPLSYHLHETVVEQSAMQESKTYSVQATSVLSATQIEKQRGQNLSDLLKNINGVTTLSTGPGIAKPVLRGLHSNRLVLLNNGIKQEGQQWGSEHAPEIDPFTVNRVEVIKGAASVEYGPEAIGGAIRLSPRAYRKENGINGEVGLQGFSNNRQGSVSGLLEGTHLRHQQFSWRVQGSLRKAGDALAPGYVISNTGLEEQNGSIALAYRWKKLQIEVLGSVFNSKIGIMRAAHIGSATDLYLAIQSDEPLIIKSFTYSIGKPYQQVWHETQSVKMSYPLKAGKIWALASRQLNSRQEYDLGVSWNPQSLTQTKPAYDLTLTTYIYDGVFEHNKWKNVIGKCGVSVMDQSNYTDGIQKPLIPNFIAYTYGAFGIEKWNKGRWTAELGARFDKRNQTIYVRKANTDIGQQTKMFQRATFIIGGGYAVNEHLNVSSTLSSAWRPPAINELYSNGLHNGTATYETGDSNLIPEQSINADVNMKYHNEKWMAELSLFRNQINNFIYQLPVQPPTITLRGTFPTFQFTQTNVVMQGTELNVSRVLNKQLIATAAISYLDAQDVSNNEPLILMPANRSRLGLQYQRAQVWRLEQFFAEMNWSYVAQQTRYPINLDYKTPPAAYHLFDATAGFDLPIQKQHIKVSVSVKNIFNVSYRDYLNRFRYFTDEPGRNIILRLTIPFTIFNK
ncbi:MAG: TonB-dependent receptor [Bacteroidota bacterium]